MTEGQLVTCTVQAVAGSCGDICIISIVEAKVVFLLKGLLMNPSLDHFTSDVVQGTCSAFLSVHFALVATTDASAHFCVCGSRRPQCSSHRLGELFS